MELLLWKPGEEEPERREVLSVSGTLSVLTNRDGDAQLETIHVSPAELARLEIVGYEPPPTAGPPPMREVEVTRQGFYGPGAGFHPVTGQPIPDETLTTVSVLDHEPPKPAKRGDASCRAQA